VFHLFCAYCDEVLPHPPPPAPSRPPPAVAHAPRAPQVLTGSIAQPGGKTTDHIITTRHVIRVQSLDSLPPSLFAAALRHEWWLRLPLVWVRAAALRPPWRGPAALVPSDPA
jgi:hypothetical protein